MSTFLVSSKTIIGMSLNLLVTASTPYSKFSVVLAVVPDKRPTVTTTS